MGTTSTQIYLWATSTTGGGWTTAAPSDIMTIQAALVALLYVAAEATAILIVIAFLWGWLKKIWTL